MPFDFTTQTLYDFVSLFFLDNWFHVTLFYLLFVKQTLLYGLQFFSEIYTQRVLIHNNVILMTFKKIYIYTLHTYILSQTKYARLSIKDVKTSIPAPVIPSHLKLSHLHSKPLIENNSEIYFIVIY